MKKDIKGRRDERTKRQNGKPISHFVLSSLLIILGAIAVDQLVKGILLYMVGGGVPLSGDAFALVPFPFMITRVFSWFNIVFTWNPGTSFSLLREVSPIIIIALTAFIIGFLGRYLFVRAKGSEKWPLALIMGGAIGNLIDRLRFGAVIDFIDWHAGAWHWPAFNIADICICAGVALYILSHLVQKRDKNR